MRVRLLLALALSLGVATSTAAQQGRRCLLQVDNIDREGFKSEPIPGNVNYFGGGNVRLSCTKQAVKLGGDSIASFGGSVVMLITKAFFRDETINVTGDTLTYFKNSELLQARGHVEMRNLKSGSTLTGPSVDYARTAAGLREIDTTTAVLRPTLRYVPVRGAQDTSTATPYLIVADLLKGVGSTRLLGTGNVTVDRDSLHGTGDRLNYEGGRGGTSVLSGAPARLVRTTSDSFRITGREILLGLDDETLRNVRAYGDGHVTSGNSTIVGDSVSLTFDNGVLAHTLAWDRLRSAEVHNEGYDIKGDSIAIDSPGEKLRELRVYRRGMVQQPLDTAAARAAVDSMTPSLRDRDTLWGNRIIASFVQVDSAGSTKTRLQQIQAIGSARSLFSRNVVKNGRTTPSINYTRADTILVAMKQGDSTGVASVTAHGAIDGVQLETATLRKGRTDSSKVALPGRRP